MCVETTRELRAGQKFDLGIEIEPRLADEIRQALEFIIRIGFGIDDDDDREAASNQLA